MTDRQKLIERIKALLAKTVENGCTEEEYMLAFEKAQAMMDAYEVTEEEVNETRKESATISGHEAHDPHKVRSYLATAVGRFVDCKVWRADARRYHTTVRLCGLPSDVEMGEWLLDSLQTFVTSELTRYLLRTCDEHKGDRNLRRTFVNGFTHGCVNRIVARLDEIVDRRLDVGRRNALVLVKTELICRRMEEEGIQLSSPRSAHSRVHVNAYEDGKAAGDRASFGRPVGSGGSSTKLLG